MLTDVILQMCLLCRANGKMLITLRPTRKCTVLLKKLQYFMTSCQPIEISFPFVSVPPVPSAKANYFIRQCFQDETLLF